MISMDVMLLISPEHSFVPAVQIHMSAIIHLTNGQWKMMKMRMMMMVAMMRVMFLKNITLIIASEVFAVMKCLKETENKFKWCCILQTWMQRSMDGVKT